MQLAYYIRSTFCEAVKLIIWGFSLPSSIALPCNGLEVDNTTTFFFLFTLFRCFKMSGKCFFLFKMTSCTKNPFVLGVRNSRWYSASPFMQCPNCCNAAIYNSICWLNTCLETIGRDGSTCDKLISFHFGY